MKRMLLLIAFVLIFINCSSTDRLPAIGEKCELTKQCLSAVSEFDYDQLNKVCNRKDEDALVLMIASQRVYVLNPYVNSYTMKEKKFGKCKIEVNTGNDKFEVWVASEFIKSNK